MARISLTLDQQRVVHEMKEVGLTQEKIAQAFDVSQPTISNILAKPKPLKVIKRIEDQEEDNI